MATSWSEAHALFNPAKMFNASKLSSKDIRPQREDLAETYLRCRELA
jgi:hypothetical protein